MKARGYLDLLRPLLPAADYARLVDLADALDVAVRDLELIGAGEVPPEVRTRIEQAKARFWAELERQREKLVASVLAAVPIDELKRELQDQVRQLGLQDPRGLRVHATLGPLYVAANLPTVEMDTPALGKRISLGPKPPNGFEARLDAGPLRGAGSLLDERASGGSAGLAAGVSGTLTANLGAVQVAALASLKGIAQGQPSFLAILSAGFTPGIQLGFGFQLNRIGGVVGIGRRLDPVALGARLSDGSAMSVLFPLDALAAGRTALQAADALFPLSPGSVIAGPTFRLAWLEVAGQGFASVDAGVLIELPGPRRIALVGVLRAGITQPLPLVRLRADFAGVVDLAAERATFDAALVDSGVLGVFTVYGDLAFATSWGPSAYTVLTFGGFYPGFRPEPAQLRPLKRLGMAPNLPIPGLRIRAEGYLAATSNTLQLGGRLEIGVDAGIASVSGFLGVDALIQFTPFHLHARIAAGLDVRFLGKTFGGVRFDGTIDGPGPMRLHGKVTVETFFKDFEWEDSFTFGDSAPAEQILPRRALDVLAAEERGPQNLLSGETHDRTVVLRAPGKLAVTSGGSSVTYAVVHPQGSLEWHQKRLPLDTPIDRVDGRPLGSIQTVRGRVGTGSSYTRERFAPGSFITLTAAQAIAVPPFDLLPGGLRAQLGGMRDGGTAAGDSRPQVLRKVAGTGPSGLAAAGDAAGFAFSTALLAIVTEREQPARVFDLTADVVVPGPDWVCTVDNASYASPSQAVRASLMAGGMALSRADVDRPVELSGV